MNSSMDQTYDINVPYKDMQYKTQEGLANGSRMTNITAS